MKPLDYILNKVGYAPKKERARQYGPDLGRPYEPRRGHGGGLLPKPSNRFTRTA